MGTKSEQDPVPTTPPTSNSPWVTYLTGKKVSANRFLQDMEDGVITVMDKAGNPKKEKTHRINRPDEKVRDEFADAILAAPGLVERLILLVQASATASGVMRRIVMDLVEHSIRRLDGIVLPENVDAPAFSHAVSSWLSSIREKPLKSAHLNFLLLFLHFGRYRQFIDDDTAFKLLATAVSQPAKSRASHVQPTKSTPTLLDLLLDVSPEELALSSFLAHFDASKAETNKLTAQVQSHADEIIRRMAETVRLDDVITSLRTEIATLEEQKASAEAMVVGLEKQIVEMRDGYRHQIYETRERIRGVLESQLTRWLQTALDAARFDPPATKAIEERLEDALKLMEKEIRWLHPSG